MKARRQELILDLVERELLRSQEELRDRLRQRGVAATQATISRDIRDLGMLTEAMVKRGCSLSTLQSCPQTKQK